MENQIIIFELGTEYFGVAISAVESIIKMQPITKLPHTPEFVEGITNLRGQVLPVIDLHRRFGLPLEQETRERRIIIVNANDTKVGMIVSAVSEVAGIQADRVEPPPPVIGSGIDASCIIGIAKVGANNGDVVEADRLVILLDIGKVLSTQQRVSLGTLSSAD